MLATGSWTGSVGLRLRRIAKKLTRDASAFVCDDGSMPTAVTTPQSFRRLQIAWVALTAILATGLLSVGLSGDLRSAQPGQGSAAEVAGPSNLNLEDGRQAHAHYGGADLNLVNARPVPVNSSGRPIIVVDFEAQNTTDFQLRLPKRHFSLVKAADTDRSITAAGGADLRVIDVDRFEYSDYSDRIVLEPGETAEATAVFKLLPGESTDLDDYNLQVTEAGRWPATIPLVGSAEPDQALLPLAFADPTQSNAVTEFGQSQISILDSESSLDFGSYRALSNEHLALFVVEIAGDDVDLVEAAKQTSFWELSVGDQARQAMRVEVGDQSDGSTTFVVVFTYPIESTDLVLHGDSGQLELAELVLETL